MDGGILGETLLNPETLKDVCPSSRRIMRSGDTVSSPLVAISILNWNGWEDTLECLESVRRLDYPNYLVVVVDNGSTNGSADKIRAWAEANLGPGHVLADYTSETALAGGDPETEQALDRASSSARLVLVRNDENLGFTGGHNVAFHYALRAPRPADYVFLLNNDASVDANCVTRLVSVARESGAGIAGAVILDESGQHPYFNGRIDMARQFFYPIVKWHLPPPSTEAAYWDSDCVHGGAMMIRADVLKQIRSRCGEYLRDGLFMYMEGAEFHHHAAALGFRSVVARNAVVYHKNAGSSGGTENPLAYYYTERNRILVGKVVLPLPLKLLFLLVNVPLGCLRMMKNLVRRRRREARAVAAGLFDGYRGVGGKWEFHDRGRAHSD